MNALVLEQEVYAYAGLQNGNADLHHTIARHLFATVLRHVPVKVSHASSLKYPEHLKLLHCPERNQTQSKQHN